MKTAMMIVSIITYILIVLSILSYCVFSLIDNERVINSKFWKTFGDVILFLLVVTIIFGIVACIMQRICLFMYPNEPLWWILNINF